MTPRLYCTLKSLLPVRYELLHFSLKLLSFKTSFCPQKLALTPSFDQKDGDIKLNYHRKDERW